MNSSIHLNDIPFDAAPPGREASKGKGRSRSRSSRSTNRVAVGIALSIAAHLLLLFAFRYHGPAARDDGPAAPERLVVYLKAPPPAPPTVAVPEPKPEPAPEAAKVRQPKPAPRRTPSPQPRAPAPATDVIALPERAADAPAPDSQFTVAPPADEKKFDPDAARKFARSIASKPDPARAGMAVAQIPEKPMETETKAARLIAGAKRANCKDVPANLLTPLLMLLDKKDSGCKW